MTRRSHSRISILLAAAAAILSYALIWFWFKPMVFCATKSDFSCFYRAGRMVIAGDGARVYDLAAQRDYDRRLGTSFVDGQGRQFSLPFVFPPYALALFAPLSRLPYRSAEFVWYVLNAGMLLALPFVLRRSLASSDKTIATQLFAPVLFVPAVLALMQGQTSILLLLLFAMAFAALDEGNDTLAGFLLAFALLKPQLMLAPLVALVTWRRWRTLTAFFWTSIALAGVSVAIVSWSAAWHYPHAVIEFNRMAGAFGGEHPESMPNLRGLIYILLHRSVSEAALARITIALSIVPLVPPALLLRRRSSTVFEAGYSLVMVVSLLVSYHAYLHDTSLLLLPFFLIGGQMSRGRWAAHSAATASVIVSLYVIPLLPASLSATAMQMCPAMLAFTMLLCLELTEARRRGLISTGIRGRLLVGDC